MAFSTVVSVVAIYELLLVRTGDRVNASLRQEVDEFRQLAHGIDPATASRSATTSRASSGSTASATSRARARSS